MKKTDQLAVEIHVLRRESRRLWKLGDSAAARQAHSLVEALGGYYAMRSE